MLVNDKFTLKETNGEGDEYPHAKAMQEMMKIAGECTDNLDGNEPIYNPIYRATNVGGNSYDPENTTARQMVTTAGMAMAVAGLRHEALLELDKLVLLVDADVLTQAYRTVHEEALNWYEKLLAVARAYYEPGSEPKNGAARGNRKYALKVALLGIRPGNFELAFWPRVTEVYRSIARRRAVKNIVNMHNVFKVQLKKAFVDDPAGAAANDFLQTYYPLDADQIVKACDASAPTTPTVDVVPGKKRARE